MKVEEFKLSPFGTRSVAYFKRDNVPISAYSCADVLICTVRCLINDEVY